MLAVERRRRAVVPRAPLFGNRVSGEGSNGGSDKYGGISLCDHGLTHWHASGSARALRDYEGGSEDFPSHRERGVRAGCCCGRSGESRTRDPSARSPVITTGMR